MFILINIIIDYLPSEKALDMHNVVILIKFVFNKNHDHYYYEMLYFGRIDVTKS